MLRSVFSLCFIFFLNYSVSAQKPNVVFILADDLGINALNCYGNNLVESPNIDRLYREGMHFTNGYSSDPTCAPSRASIMTGQYVPRHRIYRVADRFRKDPKTLYAMKYLPPENHKIPGYGVGVDPKKILMPQAMKANGYETAGFGKWHIASGESPSGIPAKFDEGFQLTGHYKFKAYPDQHVADTVYSSDYITRKGINFIKRMAAKKQAFFLYMPYYLVHKPLEPKKEYFDHFKKKLSGQGFVDDEISVLAMIKSLDENVGQLMKGIKDAGIEDNTIVIFVSDNGHYKTKGRNMFSKPYRGNKGQTYEGGIRVPYIFKWKGHIKPGSVSNEAIIHTDLYPTILGLVNGQYPKNYILDGEDLTPVLLGKTNQAKRSALVWEYTNYARWNNKTKTFHTEWVNVIHKDGFKMTEYVENEKYILYDLNKDPYEKKDIAADNPEKIKELKRILNEWKKETGYQPPRPNPDFKSK